VGWTKGPFVLDAGQEETIEYWFPDALGMGEWRGPQVALPGPEMVVGGKFVATAQGSHNAGEHGGDVDMRYVVTIKNLDGAGAFMLIGGGLT
jgi:hypothetical protein